MATKNLSATITIGGTLTAGLKGALGNVKTQLQGIGSEIGKMTKANKLLAADIRTYQRLGKGVDDLKAKYAAAVKSVDNLRLAQKRLADAQATRDRLVGRAGTISRIGAGATVAGGAILGSTIPGVNEAKHYQQEVARINALGIGKEETAKAVGFAKEMKTFGTSQVQNLELMRDAVSVFGNREHAEMVLPMLAKMKFANHAMFGSERGDENERQFMDMLKVIETRGGLKSQGEFNKQANIIQQVISATGGRVTATEWRNLIATGGIGAKGMSDEALYYTMEHLVQEQGGDKIGTGISALYSSLYQGRTTKRAAMNLDKYGLIGDKSKVKHDKAGQVSFMDPGALLGSQLFRKSQFEWMEQVLLPALAKKGVTNDDQIIDIIGSIVSNKKGADLLAAMFMQRQQIHKSDTLNRGADNIDQLTEGAKNSPAGKEADAEAKFADAKKNLGENILPLYTRALVAASDALVKFNQFTQDHPSLSNAMVVGVTAVGAALVILGPLLVVAGGLVSAYAATQLAMAARTAAATTAIEAQGVAAVATSSKLGTLAKGIGIVLAAANIGDYVAGKFGVGGKTLDQAQDDKNWSKATTWEKVQSSLPRAIENVGGFIGMTNIANEAAAQRIAKETEYMKGRDDAPPMAGSFAAGAAAPVQQNITNNITQLPGESADALAKRIAAQINQQTAVKSRSALTDGASTQ